MTDVLVSSATLAVALWAGWRLGLARVLRHPQLSHGPAWLALAAAIGADVVLAASPLAAGLVVARDLGAALFVSTLLTWTRRVNRRNWFPLAGALVGSWAIGSLFVPAPTCCPVTGEIDCPGEQVELLLELGPDDHIGEVDDLLTAARADRERAFPSVSLAEDEDLAQYYLVRVGERHVDELLTALRADPDNVDQVARNHRVDPVPLIGGNRGRGDDWEVVDDPRAREQAGFSQARGFAALELLKSKKPARRARVAILDTGVDADHEDLTDVLGEGKGGGDAQGHGTHCAGSAGAPADNGVGIASLNWHGRFVELVSYKALPNGGTGSIQTVVRAIIDATDGGADVISMSLGSHSPNPPKAEIDAIEYALERGTIVVAAAGNSARDARDHAPANIPGVIAVAAVDGNGKRAPFSNTTTSLPRPIAAPGVNILSLVPESGYRAMSGTSMAAPMVAGLVGVLRALDPDLTAEEAFTILRDTGSKGPDAAQVGQTIDMAAAIKTAL